MIEGIKGGRMPRILLTGLPGSGKSTVLLRVVERLRGEGLRIGGIITPEVRVGGRRVAFKVVDLHSGREGLLASVDRIGGPRVGRYRVDVKGFEEVALPALEYAERECDLICIDEIGRMELFSQAFRRRVEELFRSGKPLLAVVHRDYVRAYGRMGTLIRVTPENREDLVEVITSMIMGEATAGGLT